MSSIWGVAPFVGGAIDGLCNLGVTLVDGIVGPDGLFARTLDALGGNNRSRDGGVPTAEEAEALEQRLLELEQLIAERRAMLTQQASLMEMNEQAAAIVKIIEGTSLSVQGREAVMAEVTAFLSNRNLAECLGQAEPDAGELATKIDELLQQYNVLEPERVPILQQINDVLNDLEERTAA